MTTSPWTGCFFKAGLTAWMSSGLGGTNGPCSSVPTAMSGTLGGDDGAASSAAPADAAGFSPSPPEDAAATPDVDIFRAIRSDRDTHQFEAMIGGGP
mmetsp:Transcript_10250/g.23001  ORF Transcript_10250/g.23001 Transcript_10250/m.23001 type:complete len:97 (+) Transcript_10250:823-1113(+)